MTHQPNERETTWFFMIDPEKLLNPFPDVACFREHNPVFWYEPLQTWSVFRFDEGRWTPSIL